jgi:hypothetical protein
MKDEKKHPNPQAGGRYVRRADGSLHLTHQTKAAPPRDRRNPAAPAPAPQPAAEAQDDKE